MIRIEAATTVIAVPDLGLALSFFQQVLGLRGCVIRPGYAEVDAPDMVIALEQQAAALPPEARQPLVQFHCQDLPSARHWLAQHGCTPLADGHSPLLQTPHGMTLRLRAVE